MIKVIYKTKIDFNALEAWRDKDRDDIPPTGFIAVYKALGIAEKAFEYQKEHPEFEVIPLDNIFCNTMTHRLLKKFIEEIWSTYSLDIDDDNHVFWDTKKYAKGKKHYAKKLKAVVRGSLAYDLASYCPGIDDELGVNEIVLGILVPDEGPQEIIEQEEK